jgi:hypothetical protein
MTIHLARAGKPIVEFYFPGPTESIREDVQDDLTCTVEPDGEQYRYRVYCVKHGCLIHAGTFVREQCLIANAPVSPNLTNE